jgi:large subunit ribosomal protein L21
MKYAVIDSGGKQYVAREGETFEVDRLAAGAGQAVEIEAVLLAADGDHVLVGAPHVQGARVQATVEAEVRGPKILVFHYTPKKRHRKRSGHRSFLTRLRVNSITVPGGSSTPGAGAARVEPASEPKRRRKSAGPSKPKPAAAKPARPAAKPAAKKPAKPKK